MSKWKIPSTNLSQKVSGIVKSQPPLKNRLSIAHAKLENQVLRLDKVHAGFKRREAELFAKVVAAQKRNDRAHAQAYATEVEHLRKTTKMVAGAKVAMERVQMRLNTISDLGDVVVTLSPCMAIIKNINASVGSMMPQMGTTMQDLTGTLNDILGEASISNTNVISEPALSAEATAILNEAQATLETHAKSSLPNPPARAELKSEILEKRQAYT